MPNTLTSDWTKVGQSGPTIDKRTIEPTWLEQAAETYDPVNQYTAVIWVDHWRFLGSMGKVVEVKAEKEGDIVSLFAKLQPNEWLLAYNGMGQKLFTSMELDPDFAETGKAYLVGLAITDEPASLGTHELRFSSRKQHNDNIILCGVEFDITCFQEQPAEEIEDSKLGAMFRKFMGQFGKDIPQNQGANPEPEEDTMTDEQIAQFAELVGDKVGERLDGLKADLDQKFAALNPTEGTDNGTDAGAAPNEGKQTFSAELGTITSMLDEMKTDFTGKIADLTERFEKANPGTVVPATDQPAPGGKVL